MNYYVRDAREDSLARIEGPFDQKTAEQYAQQLSDFAAPDFIKRMGGKVTGPFYAVPERLLTPGELREVRRLASV